MSLDAKLPTISRRGLIKAGGAVAATAAGASAVAWPNIVLALNKVRIVIVPKGLNNPVFKNSATSNSASPVRRNPTARSKSPRSTG
jgi:hypothetical protein